MVSEHFLLPAVKSALSKVREPRGRVLKSDNSEDPPGGSVMKRRDPKIAALPPSALLLGEKKSAAFWCLGSQPTNAPITGSINLRERKLQKARREVGKVEGTSSPVPWVIRAEHQAVPPGKSGPCRWR